MITKFKEFNEAVNISSKKNLNDLDNLILLSTDNTFMIYNPINETPIGYISFGLTKEDCYSIYGAYSEHGYGPLLYEMVMTYVYPKGITMSDESTTSNDAMAVWGKFFARPDVKKKLIKRLKPTEKEEDLIGSCDGDKDCLRWVKQILFFHHRQFIFTLDKNHLDRLIEKGKLYLEQHPELNIEYMKYDLED